MQPYPCAHTHTLLPCDTQFHTNVLPSGTASAYGAQLQITIYDPDRSDSPPHTFFSGKMIWSVRQFPFYSGHSPAVLLKQSTHPENLNHPLHPQLFAAWNIEYRIILPVQVLYTFSHNGQYPSAALHNNRFPHRNDYHKCPPWSGSNPLYIQ